MDENKDDILDLTALAPKPRRVKIAEDTIVSAHPPKMSVMLDLVGLSAKLKDINKIPAEEAKEVLSTLNGVVVGCIPELEGHELPPVQLISLLEMLMDMVMPPEQIEELKKRNITVEAAKKNQSS